MHWPTDAALSEISQIIEGCLDEAIYWRLVRTGLANRCRRHSRSYCWERDANKPLRHAKHYLKVTQLQLKFCPEIDTLDLEFICIPDNVRRKGVGRRIFKGVLQLANYLEYKWIVLHSMKASEPFWLAMGFKPVAALNQNYPRRMYYTL